VVSTDARPGVRSNSGPVALAYEPKLKVRRRLKSAPDAATRFFPANRCIQFAGRVCAPYGFRLPPALVCHDVEVRP
jgi:hypothetical protein